MSNKNTLNIENILKLLPHRYPFLLIDKVIDFQEGSYIYAIKNVSFNEPFFQGHFPNKPIFPGVLILEAMAQAAGILAFKSKKASTGEIYYFAGIDNARFKHPVQPGDKMIFEITFLQTKKSLTKFKGITKVDKKIICKAIMLCARSQKR